MISDQITEKRKPGRPMGADLEMAREIGLKGSHAKRRIIRLGGAERLNVMSAEAREFMLGLLRKGQASA